MMLLLLPISATVIVLLAPLVPPLKSRGTRLLRIEVAAWLRIDGRCVVGSVSVGAGSEQFKVAAATAAAGHPTATPNASAASRVILRLCSVPAFVVCSRVIRCENGPKGPPIISNSFPAAQVAAVPMPTRASQRHAANGAQARRIPADSPDMELSPASVSAMSQARLGTDREIAVMKKARDIQKDQAQALVELVKQAP